jgi:hypothetical protein
MDKATFLKKTHIKWAREKLFSSLDSFETDKQVIEYLRIHKPEHYQKDRHYTVHYEWGVDGIEVWYRHIVGGGFKSMEEPREENEFVRLKYQDVFGWDIEWDKPAGKLSEVVTTVTEALWKK